jgi:hypothetical protein
MLNIYVDRYFFKKPVLCFTVKNIVNITVKIGNLSNSTNIPCSLCNLLCNFITQIIDLNSIKINY